MNVCKGCGEGCCICVAPDADRIEALRVRCDLLSASLKKADAKAALLLRTAERLGDERDAARAEVERLRAERDAERVELERVRQVVERLAGTRDTGALPDTYREACSRLARAEADVADLRKCADGNEAMLIDARREIEQLREGR